MAGRHAKRIADVASNDAAEFPPELESVLRKARRLEWLTIAYICSSAVVVYLTMGSSQAMRTSFFENVVSIVPAVAFLVSSRLAFRKPSTKYPYGLHSSVAIGHLTAALALVAMGSMLLIEAVAKLAAGARTTIGGVEIFGDVVWAGWPMLAALAYTGIPSFFLGRAKLRLAPKIHDKVLFADSNMMRADWMAELGAACGVIGAGFGLWWTDSLAAGLVSLNILHDGVVNLSAATTDLVDERPKKTDYSGLDPMPERIAELLRGLDWVAAVEVRMREEGHVFIGEAFVVPRSPEDLVARIADAVARARAVDWRMYDLTIMPVDVLPSQAASDHGASAVSQ